MRRHNRTLFSLFFAVLLFASVADLAAQAPAGTTDQRKQTKGFTLVESFRGSSNADGQVFTVDSAVGYNFNKVFGVYTGLPLYFVRASSSLAGTGSSSGIGNYYAGLRLALNNPVVNYSSTLTGWVPTGDTKAGRSTGRATFDWDNRFDRDFGRWTPFADLGVANTVTDTRFFRRPFTSLGRVAHFEAGTDFEIIHGLSVGASAYDLEPWGQQRVFSRLISRQLGTPGGTANASRHNRVFETAGETVGTADLTRDHGFSAWVNLSPARALGVELGYTRSARYALDTVSFGVVLNLSSLVNHRVGQ